MQSQQEGLPSHSSSRLIVSFTPLDSITSVGHISVLPLVLVVAWAGESEGKGAASSKHGQKGREAVQAASKPVSSSPGGVMEAQG
jgi:hypothetical protein